MVLDSDGAILVMERCGTCGDKHCDRRACVECGCTRWTLHPKARERIEKRAAKEATEFGPQVPDLETWQALHVIGALQQWEIEQGKVGWNQVPELGMVTAVPYEDGRFETAVGTLPLKRSGWRETPVVTRLAQIADVAARDPDQFIEWVIEVREKRTRVAPDYPLTGWFLCLEAVRAATKGRQQGRVILGLDIDCRVYVVRRHRRSHLDPAATAFAELYTPSAWISAREGFAVDVGLSCGQLTKMLESLRKILWLTMGGSRG